MKKIFFLILIINFFTFLSAQQIKKTEGQKIILTAEEQELNLKRNILQAWGKVSIKEKNWQIKSNYAELNNNLKKLFISGEVILQQSESKINCQKAEIFLNEETAKAYGKIKLISQDMEASGESLLFNYKEKQAKIKKNAKIIVKKEGKENILSADEIETFDLEKKIQAKGKAIFQQENLKLKGENLIFEQGKKELKITENCQLEIKKDEEITNLSAEKISANLKEGEEKIEAFGKVIITKSDIKAKANQAIFYIPEEKVILSGSALAFQKENQISAEKITIFLKESKIIAEGGTKVLVPERKEK